MAEVNLVACIFELISEIRLLREYVPGSSMITTLFALLLLTTPLSMALIVIVLLIPEKMTIGLTGVSKLVADRVIIVVVGDEIEESSNGSVIMLRSINKLLYQEDCNPLVVLSDKNCILKLAGTNLLLILVVNVPIPVVEMADNLNP